MDDHEWLAERFEAQRPRLRAVAQRLLGSAAEADEAVQEAWLRLHCTDPDQVENLGGWLTTVVARVCLGMLRSRGARREQPLDAALPAPVVAARDGPGPEDQALVAGAVGPAMLVVLGHPGPGPRRSPSCSTTCSRSPSPRSPRWWAGRRWLPGSWPAGTAAASGGRPALVLRFACTGDLITRIEVLSGPGRLARLELAELDG